MRWVPDWLHNALAAIRLIEKNTKLILLVGLDNAGKSTLLRKLAIDRHAVPDPFTRPTTAVLLVRKLRYLAFDLGGPYGSRPNWGHHLPDIRAVMFLVDIADYERFYKARTELHALLPIDELSRAPFVVLANKTDACRTVSEDELRYRLDLHQATGSEPAPYENHNRLIGLFLCSIALNVGYGGAVHWLLQHI